MIQTYPTSPAREGIEDVIRRHGATAVLVAALRAILRGAKNRAPPAQADGLNAHLRRDVGLDPEPAVSMMRHNGLL